MTTIQMTLPSCCHQLTLKTHSFCCWYSWVWFVLRSWSLSYTWLRCYFSSLPVSSWCWVVALCCAMLSVPSMLSHAISPLPCPLCWAICTVLVVPYHSFSATYISCTRRRSWSWQDPSWLCCPLATVCPWCCGTQTALGLSCHCRTSSGR